MILLIMLESSIEDGLLKICGKGKDYVDLKIRYFLGRLKNIFFLFKRMFIVVNV